MRSRCGVTGVLLAMLIPTLLGCVGSRPTPDPAVVDVPYRVVRPAVAFELLRDAPETLILDVRAPAEYERPPGHLAGAINIPVAELDERLHDLGGWKRRTFLVYGDDGSGVEAMELLTAHGFRYVVLIAGGVSAWREDGFGTVSGPHPSPPERADSDAADEDS